MYTYKITEWLMFFYLYCLLGWCYESTYVSLKQKKWVNRGFLHGPFLPIYGFGAISVLFTALPFRETPVAVYFVGLLTATLLEYITGVLMEALFKVRYWDYSNQKFNYRGHICLGSSIAWGFFSMAMIYGFHKPIERFLFSWPPKLIVVAAFWLSIVIACDVAISFKTAIELRDVLAKLEKGKQEVRRLQRRLEVVEAFLADEKEQRNAAQSMKKREQFTEELAALREKQAVYKERISAQFSKDKLNLLSRNPGAVSGKYKEVFEEYKKKIRIIDFGEIKEEMEEKLSEKDNKDEKQ